MKKNNFKVLMFAIFVIFTINVSAQNFKMKKIDKWSKMYIVDNIKFSYKFIQCNDIANGYAREYFVLKLENRSNIDAKINFDVEIFYDEKKINNSEIGKEFHKTIELKANDNISGNCDSNKELRVFSKSIDKNIGPKAKLTNIKLKNINVERIKKSTNNN